MRRTNLFRMVAATAAAALIATAGATAVANPAAAARPADTAAAPSTGFAPAATNLAQGRPTQESGHADVYDSSKVVDGNAGSYWESVNNAFPQWVQVDLGSSQSVNQVVLKLPTAGWGSRTQTLSVRGSTNGSSFTDLVGSQTYTFDPASGSTVTINVSPTSTRYVRITITANSGWPAGQLSELEVYGSGDTTGDTTAPSVPGTLSHSTSGSTITLNWGASTDSGGSGLAGYNVYRGGNLIATLGTVLTYQDTQPATATVVLLRPGPRRRRQPLRQQQHRDPDRQQPAGLHQRGAGQEHDGERLHLHLHPGEGERRAARHLLGGRGELPAEPDRGAGREPRHLRCHSEAQPGPGLGHPYPDHPGPRSRPGVVGVHQSGVGGDLPVRAGQPTW